MTLLAQWPSCRNRAHRDGNRLPPSLGRLLTAGTVARRGRRAAWGGRAVVRAALHRGTLVATLCNPALRQFHQSIMAAGKLKMLTLTECMRKLLTILNGMVKNGEHWDPTLVTA